MTWSIASQIFKLGWWHIMNHWCLSAVPGKHVCASGHMEACYPGDKYHKLDWWNYYHFKWAPCQLLCVRQTTTSNTPAAQVLWPEQMCSQKSEATSSPCYTVFWGRKKLSASPEKGKPTCSQEYFQPRGIIIRQESVQQLSVSRHMARKRPRFLP